MLNKNNNFFNLKNFQDSYRKLNKFQKEAVDNLEGTVMVIAGPGTGKTQVLATRIAKILIEQDVEPQNILALTFTDSAAQNMRERVVKLIGASGYYVNILTFHGFTSEIIRSYPENFPIQRNSEALSDFEKFEILENILLSNKLKILKPINDQLKYLKIILNRISELKKEYIDPLKFEEILKSEQVTLEQDIDEYWFLQEDLKKRGKKSKDKLSGKLSTRQKTLRKQKELLTVYTQYQNELVLRKKYDFDDMILFVIKAFNDDQELLYEYQEKFQYILVDEYQDTNASQNKILELLCSFWEEDPNLFVVGDPHQSIFRFQGASTENMLQFLSSYPSVDVITLTDGYRCSQNIYDASYNLISHNILDFDLKSEFINDQKIQQSLTKKLTAIQNKDDNYLNIFEADSETMEMFFIVEKIKELQKKGVSLDQISVLYHDNKDAVVLQDFLEKWDLPYDISNGENVLNDLLITELINFLQIIKDMSIGRESDNIIDVMLYKWLKLDRLSVFKLAKIAGKMKRHISELLEFNFKDLIQDYDLKEEDFNKLVDFKVKLQNWYFESKNMLFHEWFSLLLSSDNSHLTKEGGRFQKPDGFDFMNYVLEKPVKTKHLFAINSLFLAVKQFVKEKKEFSLDDFLYRVQIMRDHNLKIAIQDLNLVKDRITLSTSHSAKGKEWSYVFIINLVDGKWGNSKRKNMLSLPESILTNTDVSNKEKNEEDRRLFYVALTRASKEVFITWSKIRNDDKGQLASMFLSEISDFVKPTSQEENNILIKNSTNFLEKFLIKPTLYSTSYSSSEKDFFTELIKDFKLSVTSLENYLNNPKEFMFNSLLKTPKAKNPILSFGTAVHFALEKYNSRLQNNQFASKDELINDFEIGLKKEVLSISDFEDRLQKGKEILGFYFDDVFSLYDQDDYLRAEKPLFVEKYLGGVLNPVVLMDGDYAIKLTGRLDRVDLIDSGSKKIRIIDYKTGTPKSEKIILGESGLNNYSERELSLPKTIRGKLQRQMVFYKLLVGLDQTFNYEVDRVVFDFIEPGGDNSDKHILRNFEVSDEAVEDLKNIIIEVSREIRELKFLEE